MKVRMQATRKGKLKVEPVQICRTMANTWDAQIKLSTLGMMRKIIKEEGVGALYVGVMPTVLRASVLASVEMTVFEIVFQILQLSPSKGTYMALVATSHPLAPAVVAALVSSFFSALASCPFDVIRSRLMSQDQTHR